MKKIIVIILIILALIVLAAIGYAWLNKNLLPKEEKIIAAKENALANILKTNERGDMTIIDKPDYQIIYFQKEDQFLISILKGSFNEIREKGEKEFLQITKADKETACQLDVTITTPHFVNPVFAGKNFPLSFCETMK